MADVANNNSNQYLNQKELQKTTPIIFEGKTSEYFGIWIVNLLLSIVTLGIYSAWAKVRRKKYFYNNTLIENVGFDYHAKPISILKGRLIAVVLLVIAAINPILQSLVFLLIFIALPWLVVRGSIFNSRNSSHRGLRFDFIGTVGKAVAVFIGLPLLTVITFGLAAPYAAHEKNQFLMNNHRFGLSQFDMKRVVKGFYKVYMILFIVPIIGILAAVAIPAYKGYEDRVKIRASTQSQLMLPASVVAFAPVNAQKIVLAANEVEEVPAEEEVKASEFKTVERVYSDNNPPPASEQVAEQATPPLPIEEQTKQLEGQMQENMQEQDLQKIQEHIEQMQAKEAADAEAKMQEWMQNPSVWLIVFLVALVYILFIFGFLGYLQARIGNLIWNNTTLDKLSFRSSLRARDFALLYFTNIVAIMLTFGLATPWAQIRMARYRTSKLQIVGDVDFDQFVGDRKAEVKATGEEIAEMFDVDLSFG